MGCMGVLIEYTQSHILSNYWGLYMPSPALPDNDPQVRSKVWLTNRLTRDEGFTYCGSVGNKGIYDTGVI